MAMSWRVRKSVLINCFYGNDVSKKYKFYMDLQCKCFQVYNSFQIFMKFRSKVYHINVKHHFRKSVLINNLLYVSLRNAILKTVAL